MRVSEVPWPPAAAASPTTTSQPTKDQTAELHCPRPLSVSRLATEKGHHVESLCQMGFFLRNKTLWNLLKIENWCSLVRSVVLLLWQAQMRSQLKNLTEEAARIFAQSVFCSSSQVNLDFDEYQSHLHDSGSEQVDESCSQGGGLSCAFALGMWMEGLHQIYKFLIFLIFIV